MIINTSFFLICCCLFNILIFIDSDINALMAPYLLSFSFIMLSIYFFFNEKKCLTIISHNHMYQYLAFFICYSILCFPITGLKGGLLTFTFYMIWLGWLCECKLSNKVTLSILFVFSFVFLLWMSKVRGYFDFFMVELYDEQNENVLNSNTVGQVITIMMMVIYALIVHFRLSLLFRIGVLIGGIWGIVNCQSRNCVLAVMLFVFFTSLFKRINNKSEAKTTIVHCYDFIFWGGVLFPFIYVITKKEIISLLESLFGFAIMAKGIDTGRGDLWEELFNLIIDEPTGLIFGYNTDVKFQYLAAHATNLHSWYLHELYVFGIPGIIVVYLLYRFLIKKACYKGLPDARCALLAGFIAICYINYFEVSFSYYIFALLDFLLLGLACNDYFSSDGNGIIDGRQR